MCNAERLKLFLDNKKEECEKQITKYKKQVKVIKVLYYSLITASIIGQAVISIAAPLMVSVVILAGVSGTTAVITALTTQFQLKNKKEKLENKKREFNNIKNYIEYVEVSNGNITEDKIREIFERMST